MCCSITLTTHDNKVLLGRSLTSTQVTPYRITYVPRNYGWLNYADRRIYQSTYSVLGLAQDGYQNQDAPIFLDGMNDQGLLCAGLWFDDYCPASYNRKKINVHSYDFIYWILSQFSSVEEVLFFLHDVNFIDPALPESNSIYPLHWIINDPSNKSFVIEKTHYSLHAFPNRNGVLTNSPPYRKHLRNLDSYLPYDVEPFHFPDLPGDFSSESRFIRASLFAMSIHDLETELDGVRDIFKILQNVTPCVNVECNSCASQPESTYTVYTTAMSSDSKTYYLNTNTDNQINAVHLQNLAPYNSDILTFPLSEQQTIYYDN